MAEYDIQTCSSVWFQTWLSPYGMFMASIVHTQNIPRQKSATMCPTLSDSIQFFNELYELSKLGLKKYGPKATSAILTSAISNLRIFESPQIHGQKTGTLSSPTLHLGSPNIDDANDQGELRRHASQKSNGISQRLAVKHQGLAALMIYWKIIIFISFYDL